MVQKQTLKKTSIMLIHEEYQLFKLITKHKNSDASKTLRNFIHEYISKNKEIADELRELLK